MAKESSNLCLWLFVACFALSALVLVLMLSGGWLWLWNRTASSVPAKEINAAGPLDPEQFVFARSAAAAACVLGDEYDASVGLCGPAFRAPLAMDGVLIDGSSGACDPSFYHMMCGRWMQHHVNENRAFTYLARKNQMRIRALIVPLALPPVDLTAGGASADESALTKFYRSCMGLGTRAAQKESLIEHTHETELLLGDLRSHADLPTVFGRLARIGYTAPLVISIERHPRAPRLLPFISYDNLPDELDEQRVFDIFDAARDLTQYNVAVLQQRIQGVLRVRRMLREHMPSAAAADFEQYVNTQLDKDLMRFDALPQQWNLRAGNGVRGWELWLQALDGQGLRWARDQQVWVFGASYVQWLLTEGFAQLDLLDWRAYIEFSIIFNGHQFDPQLPNDVYYKRHDLRGPLGEGGRIYHRLLRRTTSSNKRDTDEAARSAHCVRLTQHMLPGLLARAWLDRHMPPDVIAAARAEVTQMITLLQDAFELRIRRTRWLPSADADALVNKVRSIIVRVAEPTHWNPEPFEPRISADCYDRNMRMIRTYRVQRNIGLWHKDTPDAFDRSAIAWWAIPLTETNAYWSPPTNTITVLAGLLQHPLYDTRYGLVSKYAILASVLGHELSHALDAHGIRWDAQGGMQSALTSAATLQTFYAQTDCVVREYGPAPQECDALDVPYGNATIAEDMADLTGVALAYDALFKHHPTFAQSATMGDRQHFFMVLAQAFCESFDQQHRCDAVKNDVHAVAEFRIDRTLRNMPEWRDAFGCQRGQGMYVADAQICRVWG